MKPSEANTIGQSGRFGSDTTKLCWIRSSVVARSRPAREGGGAEASLPSPPSNACAQSKRKRARRQRRTVPNSVLHRRQQLRYTCLQDLADRPRVVRLQARVILYKQRDAGACATAAPGRAVSWTSGKLRARTAWRSVQRAPSANAEQVPSVLRVTSTCTPMNFATVPSASFTGAARARESCALSTGSG